MPAIHNPLFQTYKLRCTWKDCGGTRLIEQAPSAGLRLGELVPPDPSDFNYARCPRCRRCKMQVIEVPPAPEPVGPKGFTRVPTE